LSTTCLLLGVEDGMALIESLEGVEAFFIARDGSTTMSEGFDAVYTPY
jgi:thiamine biosynthesis lipoprotein